MNNLPTIGNNLPPRRDQLEVQAARLPVPILKGKKPEAYIKLEPKDRFLDQMEREMLPTDLKNTLAGALTGDLHRQGTLFNSMLDSWYRLQSNIDEVQTKVSKAPFTVQPHAENGEEPSDSAVEKAQFVEKLLQGMKANPVTGEQGLKGLIRDLALGFYTGHAVNEVYWKRGLHSQGSSAGDFLPYSNKNIPWRFLAYPSTTEDADRLMLAPEGYYGQKLEDFPAHKFVIAVKRGHGGHPTQSAPLRTLTSYWLASTYGLKWLLGFAQIYGIPLRMANYVDDGGNLQKVCDMLENMGSQSWGAFPEGTKIDVVDAAKSAGDLPQKLLIENADKACDIFILGQTLTTDVGDSGSRALGDVHADVRMDKLQAVADFVAEAITTQLVQSIVQLNYGNTDEMPCVKIEFPRPQDEMKLVERDRILHVEMGLPVAEEELYKRHNVKRPEEGAKLFSPRKESPNGVQGDPATGENDHKEPAPPHKTKAARVEANRKPNMLDTLVDGVLENLTGVSKEWLEPVKPHFMKLAAMAESPNVSDEQFIEALSRAEQEMPELFDHLNDDAIREELENAMNSAMLSGSVSRYEGGE